MTVTRHITAAAIAGLVGLSAVAQDTATQEQGQANPQPAAAAAAATGAAASNYDPKDAAYGLGYSIGQDISNQGMNLDTDAFIEGLRVSLEGGEPRMSQQQMQSAIERFQQAMIQRQMQMFQQEAQRAAATGDTQRQQALEQQIAQMQQMLGQRQQGEQNLTKAQQFLEQNKQEPDVQVTESGLQYKVLEEGSGASPSADDTVRVHYRGTLLDGTEFDSSYARGEPAEFGVSQVISGWTEALQKMKVGGKWKLWIPPSQAYGARGQGPIPPNSLLVFEVELLDIVSN